MEAIVLNKSFEQVAIIDNYKSFIWTERYNEHGDFELYIPVSDSLPDYIKKNYYLWKQGSETLMIIESLEVETTEEDGSFLIVTGKSLQSILKRRVVWNKRIFEMHDDGSGEYVRDKLQDAIVALLTENIPSSGARSIPNFFIELSDDPRILKLELENEYLGQELYEVVSNACKEHEIGFKIDYAETYIKDGKEYDNAFVFKLFKGVDHSYEQDENPYVVFSPEFTNIASTNYLDSEENLKNVVLVVGETTYNKDGTEESRYQTVVASGEVVGTDDNGDPVYEAHIGLDRRESFVDSTGLSTKDDNDSTIAVERYTAMLKQKGIDALMEKAPVMALEGEVEPVCSFNYKVDYDIGDIVQLVNEYGHEGRARVTEYVESYDDSGFSAHPTFESIKKGWYESDE